MLSLTLLICTKHNHIITTTHILGMTDMTSTDGGYENEKAVVFTNPLLVICIHLTVMWPDTSVHPSVTIQHQ